MLQLLFAGVARLALAAGYSAVGVTAASQDQAASTMTELVDVKLYVKVAGLAAELPRIYEPYSVPGLPKGKWFVALSFCGKKPEAAKLAAAIRGRAPAVSVVAVRGTFASQCLPRRALEPFTDEESGLIQAALRDAKLAKPRVEYAKFLQIQNRLPESEAQLKKALELEPNNFEASTLLQVIQVMRQP
ncbi:MAG: hypothetical protein HY903_09440 [Deltaproteobacteria bacterium]|nr:hypothetical protein [Deltaproteobacteria bacterium]